MLTPIKIRIDGNDYDLYPDRIVAPDDPAACYLAVRTEIQIEPDPDGVYPRAFETWDALDLAIQEVTGRGSAGDWYGSIDAIVTAAVALVAAAAKAPQAEPPQLADLRAVVQGSKRALKAFRAHPAALAGLDAVARQFKNDFYTEEQAPITLEVLP